MPCRYIAPKVSRRIASVVRKEAIINGKELRTSFRCSTLYCANCYAYFMNLFYSHTRNNCHGVYAFFPSTVLIAHICPV